MKYLISILLMAALIYPNYSVAQHDHHIKENVCSNSQPESQVNAENYAIMKYNEEEYTQDILGEGFEQLTLRFEDDFEGEVIATLIRSESVMVSSKAILYIHGFNDYFFQKEMAQRFNQKGFHFYALDLRKYGRSYLPHQKLNNLRSLEEYDEEIKADIEMGGTDQLFNCTMGRQLQESLRVDPQIMMCMPLLKGLDGKEKMSKSLNNTIGLTDTPNDMFGKTMSIPDSLINEYLHLATDFSNAEIDAITLDLSQGKNPMMVKKLIAKNIITQNHNKEAAEAAEVFFSNQFQNQNFDEKSFEPISIHTLQHENGVLNLLNLCFQLKKGESKSAIRRLIKSGAIRINDKKTTEAFREIKLLDGLKIKIGKRDFYELKE